MTDSLSGCRVDIETIILVNPHLKETRRAIAVTGFDFKTTQPSQAIVVPEGHRIGGVGSVYYNGYRQGLDSACADLVITTCLPVGGPAVLASKRAPGKLFGKKWWMQGGAIHSYRLIQDFLGERINAEAHVSPQIQGLIGVFRTCADDVLGSTINLCYVGYVPYPFLEAAGFDGDHTAVRLLSQIDLNLLPDEERHWYPMYAFAKAIETMPGYIAY
ncbi:MAG: hypothetical protein Q8R30_03965 [bacterium]|nr:hypothetical protein [bacterium]MDZ4285305.1 hypothetical protein [Candidatus Sungbacteria bacterium]